MRSVQRACAESHRARRSLKKRPPIVFFHDVGLRGMLNDEARPRFRSCDCSFSKGLYHRREAQELRSAKASVLIAKKRMGLERRRRFLFVANNLRRRVQILLAAIVAAHAKPRVNGWPRRDAVRQSKRNPVFVEQVLSQMVEVVLAEHHPAVLRIFPHPRTPAPGTGLGRTTSEAILAAYENKANRCLL